MNVPGNTSLTILPEIETVFLKPGEICLLERPAKVTTILGSCIAVTMYNARLGKAAMCHAVLPKYSKTRKHDTFQYVDSSIIHMIEKLESMGSSRTEIEVKMFGGASMFSKHDTIAVGRRNIETAITVMSGQKLNLKAWNVGGSRGRKLIFDTSTGEVFVKFIKQTMPAVRLAV